MSAEWFLDLEDKIFTEIKHNTQSAIVAKFPNARFTTSDASNTTKFPNIYIHELTGSEGGVTLEQTDVNAIVYTVEVQVATNTTREDNKWIMKNIIPQLKSIGFSITSTPIIVSDSNIYTSVVRAKRTIASGDNL